MLYESGSLKLDSRRCANSQTGSEPRFSTWKATVLPLHHPADLNLHMGEICMESVLKCDLVNSLINLPAYSHGQVAQLVEHHLSKQKVASSNPGSAWSWGERR